MRSSDRLLWLTEGRSALELEKQRRHEGEEPSRVDNENYRRHGVGIQSVLKVDKGSHHRHGVETLQRDARGRIHPIHQYHVPIFSTLDLIPLSIVFLLPHIRLPALT